MAYQEALKIRTQEKNPVKYFLIQKAIGDAYYELSLKKDRNKNLLKALDAYQKFLGIESKIHGFMHLQTLCKEVKNKIQIAKRQKEEK